MAREALTIAGQAIGYYYGGVPGAVVGSLIGSAVGNAIDPADPVYGPRLEDRRIQISSFGVPVGLLYGVTRTAGNVIWAADLEEVSTESGGKGGGTSAVNYSYYATFAVLLSANRIRSIRRIWADTVLIYDSTAQIDNPVALAPVDFTLYRGDEQQLPDPTMEAALGVGNVPAYRGYAYVVFNRLPISAYGNRIPSLNFEVVGEGEFTNDYPATPMGATHAYNWDYMVIRADGALVLGNKYIAPGSSNVNGITLAIADPRTGAIQASADIVLSTPPVWIEIKDVVYVPPINELWVLGYSSDYYTRIWRLDAANLTLVENKPVDYPYWDGGASGGYGLIGYYDAYAQAVNTYRTSAYLPNQFRQYDLDANIVGIEVDGIVNMPLSFVGGGEFCAIVNGSGRSAAVRTQGEEAVVWLAGNPQTTRIGQGTVLANQITTELAHAAFDPSRSRYLVLDGDQRMWWVADSLTPSFELIRILEDATAYSAGGQMIYVEGLDAFVYLGPTGYIWVFDGGTSQTLLSLASIPNSVALTATMRPSPNDPQAILVAGAAPGANLLQEKVLRGTTVGSTVAALCRHAGYTSADIDVSELTQRLRGFRVMQVAPPRQAIEQLGSVYFFDGGEQDDQLVFKRRGRAASASYQLADCVIDEPDQQPLQTARAQEASLPRRLTLTAPDPATDYQPGAQQAQRQTVQAGSDEQLSVDVVLSVDEARRTADALIFDRWQSRTTAEFKLTLAALRLTAGDVITLDGRRYRVRQRTVEDFTVRLDVVADDPDVIDQLAAGAAGNFPSQSVRQVVATTGLLLDTALLRDADDEPGAYWAAWGIAPHWRGAILYGSADAGVSWASLATMPTPGSIMGVATTALGPWSGGNVFDETQRLTVRFTNGAPSSVSRAEVLAGSNAAALRSGTSWEILQFRSAVANPDGTYTLSGLLRGRRGTEHAMAGHAVGDDVVLLSPTLLRTLDLPTSALGAQRQYRSVSIGASLEATTSRTFTAQGERLRPWSPVALRAARNPASGDLTLSWKRRTRLARRFTGTGGIHVPLGEASEAYDVEIWDSSYSTLKRTFSGLTTASAAYTAAQQSADFGGVQATVHVRIYQLSDRVGRGRVLQDQA